MGLVPIVCGVAALVSALPAAVFLPGTARRTEADASGMAAPTADARQ
jgi:hypothetical protein